MTLASTLDGRLLCASRVAHWIPLAPEPVYFAGAGFSDKPMTIIHGPDQIDACLVGELPDGLVIAFRGTEMPDDPALAVLRDWIGDLDALPIPVNGFPGYVHSGFSAALRALLPDLIGELSRRPEPRGPILVTGHSKGASVAMLAAWALQATYGLPVKAVTFAGARVGDTAFAAAFAAKGIDLTRYEYGNDVVPHLPPSSADFMAVLDALPSAALQLKGTRRYDYQPVGRLRYIARDGEKHPDSVALRHDRALSLALAIVRGEEQEIKSDHHIYCGCGYAASVAPEVCAGISTTNLGAPA